MLKNSYLPYLLRRDKIDTKITNLHPFHREYSAYPSKNLRRLFNYHYQGAIIGRDYEPYLEQQGVRRSLLWARPGSAWWSVMACSFRDPSSRILWQRCLCTCCTELSSPCNNAASWLCSFLSSPIKLIRKRFRVCSHDISIPSKIIFRSTFYPSTRLFIVSSMKFEYLFCLFTLSVPRSDRSSTRIDVVLVVSGGRGATRITIDSPIDGLLSRAPRFASSSL